MLINNIAVHRINKISNDQAPIASYAEAELDCGNEDINEFGISLANTYLTKKSRSYTIFFVEEDIEPPFKQKLDSYIDSNNFFNFSKQLTVILKDEMHRVTLSRGGYVIIMDYNSTNGDRYLFIALLNNKENFSVDDDSMEVIKNLALNIEHMAMATILNLSRYQENQDNYITFLKGLRAIPDYFISFVGADQNRRRDIKEVTKQWTDAINEFFENREISSDIIEERTNSLLAQVKRYNREDEPITAEIIANIIYPDQPDEFIDFVYNEDSLYELPAEMDRLDTQVLNKLNFVNYIDRNKGFGLKFKRKDIGNMIDYNDNEVIIRDSDIAMNIRREIENG